MKIAEGLHVLELGSIERRMHLTLIFDNENAVLFDAGLPGLLKMVKSFLIAEE